MTPESPARTTEPAAYTERLGVSPWAWAAAVAVDLIVGVEVLLSFPSMPAWVPFAVLAPLTAAVLLRAGRITVTVTAGELRVDDARLPLSVIADVIALDAAGKRESLGVGSHPMAFIIQRPWIGPAVQVLLDDPADPTPFWVISTRRPVELATALLNAANLR
ncbi:DUF3093 domain-containing protein [Paractinoplanes durhamensis]|uniref:DUF3093 domain-containing protein n=1 Tax=Paractinoplanes durhamensis TaxID=113563 RepID=A0ABQ3YMX0_9ACTN|nr:DUF3093 domain-containing protein [Actinoplanes durhamensis]GID98723.1 hypothetical protein Adu01nite_00740 [Actinoplanes durhamensis]